MPTSTEFRYCKILEKQLKDKTNTLEKMVKGQNKYIKSNVLTWGPEESLQLVHGGQGNSAQSLDMK